MSDEVKLDKTEFVKEDSRQLRGTIADELAEGELDHFSKDNAGLLKHHGLYQQDNRDARKQKNADGTRQGKAFMFMVRTRIPGGRVPADALLAELDLCERYGNQTLRITSRQGLQLHGIIKDDLQETIREINQTQLTTFGACGDIERNVMCCPAPLRHDPVHDQLQLTADAIAEELKPRTTAYSEIWLEDEEGNRQDVTEFTPVDEPIYGARYLPRKFKSGVALPEDNCVDILTYDLGLLGIVESGGLVGYNVFVGGGQGVTPSAAKTFPTIAQKMAFIGVDEAVDVARALVCVFRDHGNRSDRKTARLKYLLAGWGMERFKSTVEEYLGRALAEPHPADVTGVEDHLGWNAQGDGRDFLGIYVENGRIQDTETDRTKSALRTVVERFRMPTRMTAQQNILLCDIESSQRDEIDRILADHGVVPAEDRSGIRRLSMACPALPTCGLSITESERVMPGILDQLESELSRQGLAEEQITIHMTGCPNGCARPYSPDIGLVGKTMGKYTLFLGGNSLGSRLAYNFRDLVPLEEIVPTLSPVLACFREERLNGEAFGDFCDRKGRDELLATLGPIGEGE
ncbi:MAG: NADPH-dependent assimilatory sulfite reductase hemoprotein subunit [Planctomycetota bacterium]|nr:NADPH-dependent assimilatory sulfite reductase hemoprotein subunit [Planctomycetota bacterium]